MAKYNVGDKVKVRGDLRRTHGASHGMTEKFAGKVVTISDVEPDTMFGKMSDTYYIAEEKELGMFKHIWGDQMFEGLATEDKDVKPANKMPKLTTGMFGVDVDGEMWVVVNDHLIYRNCGKCEYVSFMEEHPELIKAIYDAICFLQIQDGEAEVIWENPNPKKVEDIEDIEDTKVTKVTAKDEDWGEFIAMLEKLFGDDE